MKSIGRVENTVLLRVNKKIFKSFGKMGLCGKDQKLCGVQS